MLSGDAFELVPAQALGGQRLDQGWWVRRLGREAGERAGFAAAEFAPGADWQPVSLPHADRATATDDTLWYRFDFEPGDAGPPGARRVLRFGSAFLDATVWLNGVELGGHYGYFAPFAFDVTERLRAGANRLTVRVQTPVELGDLRRKRHVMGVFNDWDCKPYPNKEIGNLPDTPEFPWFAPVGLTAPVELLTVAPAVAEWLRVETTLHPGAWRLRDGRLADGRADVVVTLHLRNLGSERVPVRLVGELAPEGRIEPATAARPVELTLGPGEVRDAALGFRVDQPWLWWPWTHGAPNRHRLAVSLTAGDLPPTRIERSIGLREVRVDLDATPGAERAQWWLNGRRIFPKGSNYICDFDPVRATPERIAADLALMRAANMDLVRVHAHIADPAFYAEADRTGLLVMADLPLIFTYAWEAPADELERFRARVLAQTEAAAHLLQPHPSVALWSVHNEPPWPRDMAYVGAAHHAGWNRDVDRAAAERLRTLVPGGSVLEASGDLDEHIYCGWYIGTVEDGRNRAPRFPTEYGAQALPDRESPFWERVSTDWPVEPDDPTWVYADYQPIYWARFGVGEPAGFPDLATYIAAGQAYQAWLLRWLTDGWRIRKFRPTGGLIQFMFVDCHPAITWSVVDYYRRPKFGWAALRDAFEPTHLALDFRGDYHLEHRYELHYRAGATVGFDLWLVNDDYGVGGEAELSWELVGGPRLDPLARFRRLLGGDGLRGWQGVAVPHASEPARPVLRLERALPNGLWALRAELRQGGRLLSAIQQPFRVGAGGGAVEAERFIVVPGFIVGRVYRRGSLRNLPGDAGFAFDLVNHLQPATLTALLLLRVDGLEVPFASVSLHVRGEQRRAADISEARPLITEQHERAVVEVAGEPLRPGEHTIEIAVRIVGFGDALVRVQDRLPLPP